MRDPIVNYVAVAFTCFVFGAVVATQFREQNSIQPKDLVEAYEQGKKDVLDAEKPSDRLEAVCAALWLKK